MKKYFLLLLVPLLLAMQCDKDIDAGFETAYLVQNDSGRELFLLSPDNIFIELKANAPQYIGAGFNSDPTFIVPSQGSGYSALKLYEKEGENFLIIFSQDPLQDDLWILSEPAENQFEYTLIITEELIGG